jgi:hypothetical protein
MSALEGVVHDMKAKPSRQFVYLFIPAMADLVVSGQKSLTIRRPKGRMPRAGDKVSLRRWAATSYRSRQIILLDTVISSVEPVEIHHDRILISGRQLSKTEELAFAKSDGFKTPQELTEWFCFSYSIYKAMPGLDVWDADRDALNYQGPYPIIAHPPCRRWGCLRMNAKHTPEEKALGPWAVEQVRKWGGVLEHPRASTLWSHCGLPGPGRATDEFGGFSIDVEQHWWGHRARKRTWLYICGCRPADVPSFPIRFSHPPRVITNIHGLRAGMPGYRPEVTKAEREATPPAFASWLVELASRTARKEAMLR